MKLLLSTICVILSVFCPSVQAAGNFTTLKTAVENAEAYLKTAQSNGKYPQAAIDDYQDVVTYSRAILDQATADQAAINAQVAALKNAKTQLNASAGFTFITDNIDDNYDTDDRGFRHPGGLHTWEDFDRVKAQLTSGNTKVTQAYNILKSATYAQPSAASYPVETIVRGGSGENYINAARGATIAYQNGLRWKIEGNKQCAQHAVDVLMAWARTTTGISGDSNYALTAGLYGYQFAQAAELVRDYSGWGKEDFQTFQRWMLDVWYPSAIGFLRGRNGTWENSSKWWRAPGHYWSNWGLCNALCVISIGVLCDDVNIYNQGMSFIKYDQVGTFTDPRTVSPLLNDGLTEFWGNLVVTTYPWDKETGAYGKVGQMNESGRDAGHCGMAVGLAVDIAHQGWNQGDDLFAYMDHRIAAGIEYVAAQTQSQSDLPWTNYKYGTNGIYYTDSRCWEMTGPVMGAQIRPCWGTVIGIYEGVKGIKMPWSEKAYASMGIDGGGSGSTSGGYDQLGYNILMNTRDNIADRKKAPVELQPHIIYNSKTLDHNELGNLTNTYGTTAEKSRAVARGTVITFSPTLPDSILDTGNWRWETGETTRELTVTANRSHIYHVHYTNQYGVESEQCYAIAVQGDCQSTTLNPSITVNGVKVGTTSATVSYGSNLELTLTPTSGWGNYEWENGLKTQSITLNTVTHDRTITGCFISQTGRRCYQQFTIHVTPLTPTVTISGTTSSVDGDIFANEGDSISLNASVAEALLGGTWKWNDGSTEESIVIDSIITSHEYRVTYSVNGRDYSQTYNVLVRPTKPILLTPDYYTIRLHGTDLYLTGTVKGDTLSFSPVKGQQAIDKSQIWYLNRTNSTRPYYSACCMNDSSFMSSKAILISTGAAKPHHIVFAHGTDRAFWYTSSTSNDHYMTVDAGSGLINMQGEKAFYGYPFEVTKATLPTGTGEVEYSTCPTGKSPVIYNLNGQRVSTILPGHIYIVDGKKKVY